MLYSRFQGKGELLEQPEDFEDDHDNDNHSNDVKDVSVHAGDSYQSECAVASIIQTERLPEYAAWEIHPVLALHVGSDSSLAL